MIIDNFNIFCAGRGPAEADAELIVHTNTVLPATRAVECFQAVARWNTQIVKPSCNL